MIFSNKHLSLTTTLFCYLTLLLSLTFNSLAFGVVLPEGVNEEDWLNIRSQINVHPLYDPNKPSHEESLLLNLAIFNNTLVVGAPAENGDESSTVEHQNNNGNNTGAVYVFIRSGRVWKLQAYLKASNLEDFDMFGYSVAISGDTIVVGAPQEDGDRYSTATESNENADNAGAVYIFRRHNGSWEQQAYLKSSTAGVSGPALFGYSVAIEGTTIVVGSPYEFTGNKQTGAAQVFNLDNMVWVQVSSLKANPVIEGDRFGLKVSVSADTISVSALEYGRSTDETSVYIFNRTNHGWIE